MRTRIAMCVMAALTVVCAVCPRPVFAQGVSGSRIYGHVSDPSGAVIPDAEVVITSQTTGSKRTLMTGSDGIFVALDLTAGVYDLEVAKTGFKPVKAVGVVVQVNENARRDIQMELGTATTVIEVAGRSTLVNTYTSNLAETINARRVVELPLNARDVTSLTMLSVGATDPVETTFYASSSGFAGTAPSVNGSRIQDNNYLLDGVSNIYSQRLSSNLYPNPDAVQEVTVETGQYSAEFGDRPGAQVNARTKSGTNMLHGSAFEFVRNPYFNARRWEDTRGVNDGLKRHQYGWAVGGPVYIPKVFDGRNKLFWFNSYQRIPTQTAGTPGFHLSWTAPEKQGDFSDRLTGNTKQVPSPLCDGSMLTVDTGAIFDPRTANSACGALGNPFPGNVIDPTLIDPVAFNFMNGHTATSSFVGEEIPYFIPGKSTEYQVVTKIDYIAGKHAVMFRFIDGLNNILGAKDINDMLWGSGQSTHSVSRSWAATETWTPTSNLVASVGFVYIKNPWNLNPHSALLTYEELGGRLTSDPDCKQIRTNSIVGFADWNQEDICGIRFNRNWEFNGSAKWIKGRHEIGFGGNLGRWEVGDTIFEAKHYGQFKFDGTVTGLSAADFVIGRAQSFTINSPGPPGNREYRRWRISLFAQDNFRVNRKLTLNLGVRWEPHMPGYQAGSNPRGLSWIYPGQQSQVYVNAPPDILYVGDAGTPGTKNSFPRYNQFAPRFGFALDPTGSGKWAIRGGIGGYFGLVGGGNSLELSGTGHPPLGGSTVTILYPPSMVWPWDAAPYNGVEGIPLPPPTADVAIAPPVGNAWQYDPNTKGPLTWTYSFGIERSLPSGMLLRAGYVGTRGVDIQDGYQYNLAEYIPGASSGANTQARRPNPLLTAQSVSGAMGDSWYNSLQVTVEKRYSEGLSFLTSYTFSKSVDTNSASIGWGGGFGTTDPRGPAYNRGLSGFDRRHVFSFAPIWYLPRLRNQNQFVRAVAGNWEITGITSLRTGHPSTVTYSGDICLCGAAFGGSRADAVPGVESTINSDSSAVNKPGGYIDTAAFQAPAEGTLGTVGRNTVIGPGLANVDAMLAKNFPIGETVRLQFRAEFFNLFNRVNLNNPNLNLNNSNFGRITTTVIDPRIMQFGVKVEF